MLLLLARLVPSPGVRCTLHLSPERRAVSPTSQLVLTGLTLWPAPSCRRCLMAQRALIGICATSWTVRFGGWKKHYFSANERSRLSSTSFSGSSKRLVEQTSARLSSAHSMSSPTAKFRESDPSVSESSSKRNVKVVFRRRRFEHT